MDCIKITSVRGLSTCGNPAKSTFLQRDDGSIIIEQMFLVDENKAQSFHNQAIPIKKYKDRVLFTKSVGIKGETFVTFLTDCLNKGILSTNDNI